MKMMRDAEAIHEVVQARFDSEIPAHVRADSPLSCLRMLHAVRLGFRDAVGVDGQPCACGGLLRPYIVDQSTWPRHLITFGLRCDNPECIVEIIGDWQRDQCPTCSTWCEEIDPSEYPEWVATKYDSFDRLLWCRTCRVYLVETVRLDECE